MSILRDILLVLIFIGKLPDGDFIQHVFFLLIGDEAASMEVIDFFL